MLGGDIGQPADPLRLDPELADPPPLLCDVAEQILSETLPDFDGDSECLYVDSTLSYLVNFQMFSILR
jgi:hypothetical protein